MRTLTTKEAETIYHIPADTFTQWCREGSLSATKVGREWQLAIADIDAFLTANPALRPASAQRDSRAWVVFGAIATMLGFVVDAVALYDITRGGDRTLLWLLAGILSLALWVAAVVVMRVNVRKGILGYSGNEPIYNEEPRFTNKVLRNSARILIWAMPVLLILGVVGYNIWRVVPPSQTVVLVADFRDPTGVDSARVTQSLVDGMRGTLKEHPSIQVERLNQFIPAEGGSELARSLGSRPEHKAAFVIWGDYTLEPEPELHIHFDILRQTATYLRSGQVQDYGPLQIQQPNLFDFKTKLGAYLGQLVAFASGLALFDAGKNLEAILLFDTAAQAVGQPPAEGMERAIRFFRGSNYLVLGRALDAKPDFQALVPSPDENLPILDNFTIAALGSLGTVAAHLGDYAGAKDYYELELAVNRQLGRRLNEAVVLGNLGLLANIQGDYVGAKAYDEQALALFRQLGYRLGEAAVLNNLGVLAHDQGDYVGAETYHEQALALHRELGNRLGEAAQLGNLGNVAYGLGDYARSTVYYEQALSVDRKLGDRPGEAAGLGGLGMVAVAQGDYAGAKAYYERALALYRELGDREGEAGALGNLGVIAVDLKIYAEARAYLEQALALFQQLGHPPGEATLLGNRGLVAAGQGDYAGAKAYYERALALRRELGDRQGEAVDLRNLGWLAHDQGDYVGAETYHEQALALHRELGNRLGEAAQLGNLGNVARKQGDYAGAKAYYERALALHRELGDRQGKAVVLGNLGLVARDQGDFTDAKTYLEESARLYQELGVPIPEVLQSALDELTKQP